MRVSRIKTGGYMIPLICPAFAAPVDSATYYIGTDLATLALVYSAVSAIIPKAGRIRSCTVKVRMTGVATAENVVHSLRINDATDLALGTAPYNVATVEFNVTNLSHQVNVGDTMALKVVNPAWATNPSSVRYYAYVYIE